MDVPSRDLSLDDFICEMSREPVSSLTHERLMDLAGRLRLSEELVGNRIAFAAGHLRPQPGVPHAASSSCSCCAGVPVRNRPSTTTPAPSTPSACYSGELTSRMFRRIGGRRVRSTGPVVQDAEERVGLRDARMVGVDRDGIHQLANTSGHDLVTVHIYAPALTELNVYSTTSAVVERRRLRYTLADELD